jgi:hypothetical protein
MKALLSPLLDAPFSEKLQVFGIKRLTRLVALEFTRTPDLAKRVLNEEGGTVGKGRFGGKAASRFGKCPIETR